jgi:small-conductance mechanosensitive channel
MRRWLLLILFVAAMLAGPAVAQPKADEPKPPEPTAEELRNLADLLGRPGIQAWLKAQAATPPAQPKEPAATGPASAQQAMHGQLDRTRRLLHEVVATVPTLPAELNRVRVSVMDELRNQGLGSILLPLAFFAMLGFGAEWLFWRATTGFRQRLIASSLDTVDERLRAVGMRIFYGLGLLLAFAVGSIGAFLALPWPPLLQRIVLAYLLVFLIVRLVLVGGRIVLAPGAERFRLVPMATATARFWFVWSAVLVGWFFFAQFTFEMLPGLGLRHAATYCMGLAFGLVMLGLALFALWRAPSFDGTGRASRRHRITAWLLSLYLVCVWLSAFSGDPAPFYIGIVLLILPIAITGMRLAVAHVLRPPGSPVADAATPSLTAVALERGLRAVLLIGGAWLVAWIMGLDLAALTSRDTLATRLVRGVIHAVIIALVADFAWHLARAWIDRKLAAAVASGPAEGEEARRRARLRTLLPILKNLLLIVLLVMAVLMGLSALGVEVGPLIAGAGVVGVAIGFGAQTLVKDIISGMFFLLDDAFRVGEYIESGKDRGTVEAFSLRSIKLRHHRGALHTIPFGSLEKITNYSRDWVIDKMTLSLTYDTDLDLVKKIVKQVGRDLQADPALAPHIIETLKMQGVEQFGDFAIQVRLKMMTKPGEQFVIRRRAYGLIKKVFAANNIEFAFPTVTVAGGRDPNAAIAQKGLELMQPPPAGATT